MNQDCFKLIFSIKIGFKDENLNLDQWLDYLGRMLILVEMLLISPLIHQLTIFLIVVILP